MILKCGRREFEVSSKDEILDNGVCYQLVTQTYSKGFYNYYPKVSKVTFNQLLKEGKIYKRCKYKDSDNCWLYRFTED